MSRRKRLFASAESWETRNIHWKFLDIVKLVAVSLLVSLLIYLVLGSRLDTYTVLMLGRVVGLIVMVMVHVQYRFWPSAAEFGMTLADFRRYFRTGVVWGLAAKFLPTLVIIIILIPISIFFREQLAGLDLESNLGMSTLSLFSLEWFALAFSAVIIAPIWEELLMRGILYPYLRRDFGRKVAVVVSSLVFALLHGFGFVIIPTFIGGVLLAALYERTGSLAPCIIAHAVFNLVAVVAQMIPGLAGLV